VAVAIGCASASSAETAAVPSFAGRWKLNKELSDKPPAAPEAAKPAAEEKKDGVESSKPPDVAPASSGEFTPEGRLQVDTRIAGGGQRAATTKRVYDRVSSPPPGAGSKAP
jgi:hypothetical protein